MSIQELQIKYVNGEISYNEYLEKLEQLRNNPVKNKNNSWFYILGVGCLFLLGSYFSKKR